MTGLCIILIGAVVARQETQKKGHLVVYKPMCAAEYKRHRRIFRSSKDECAIFSICGYSYFYYYCKPLISKPVFLLPRAANDLQTHNSLLQ